MQVIVTKRLFHIKFLARVKKPLFPSGYRANKRCLSTYKISLIRPKSKETPTLLCRPFVRRKTSFLVPFCADLDELPR
ncbi:MAG: hypothetical protein CL920_21290 [Deltaproteobacteria bacterium]|nr:hypothetical protein [Deltaproteobacteria bacterium]MBU51231.1 hypothetical protein [Deltaproteobacteria bacterium]